MRGFQCSPDVGVGKEQRSEVTEQSQGVSRRIEAKDGGEAAKQRSEAKQRSTGVKRRSEVKEHMVLACVPTYRAQQQQARGTRGTWGTCAINLLCGDFE